MEFVLLLVFAFIARVLPLSAGASDNWLVWYNINNQTKPWLNHRAYNSLVDGVVASPKLQYYLVSLFPGKYRTAAGNFLNIAYDLMVMAMLYGLARGMAEGNTGIAALLVGALYASAPILLPPTARLTGVKARTLGGLIAFLYLLALEQALLYAHPGYYAVCGVLAILSVLCAAFAMQVVVFFSLCLSIFYLTPAPLLAAVVPVIIAYFIPGLGLKEVVHHKINHYMWYFDSYAGTTANGRNDFRGLWRELRNERRYNVILYHLFMTQSVIIALYSLPTFLVLACFLATDGAFASLVASDPAYTYYALILLASFILFVVTSTRYFRFLGEAERYFEYAFPFSCLLMIPLLETGRLGPAGAMSLVLYQVTVVFCILFFKHRFEYLKAFRASEADPEDLDIVERIRGLPVEEPKVLVIPTKYAFRLAALTPRDAGIRYLLYFVTSRIDGFSYMKRAFRHYEALEFDFDFIRSEYGVNTVVAVNDQCGKLPKPTQAALAEAELVGHNGRYTLYSLR
ncbi:hypothetical protein GKC30_07785 [Pseudodesulfovibrio sp. F-1]|uniref:Glycosyltransferase RgtA/B/C/D-like domain-containing protein n=1 Tax=Pseudodesulfovibrio alkaliphilus TaxID=2661613 RepID=A0A7K1KN68_9BACT|nr:hypothetical protein [Pseudodesulfovibrio alkaliphilus]MUM77528.1 hypothetical protein [Pseudodesulfovibrio alkaliphilus]